MEHPYTARRKNFFYDHRKLKVLCYVRVNYVTSRNVLFLLLVASSSVHRFEETHQPRLLPSLTLHIFYLPFGITLCVSRYVLQVCRFWLCRYCFLKNSGFPSVFAKHIYFHFIGPFNCLQYLIIPHFVIMCINMTYWKANIKYFYFTSI